MKKKLGGMVGDQRKGAAEVLGRLPAATKRCERKEKKTQKHYLSADFSRERGYLQEGRKRFVKRKETRIPPNASCRRLVGIALRGKRRRGRGEAGDAGFVLLEKKHSREKRGSGPEKAQK